MAVNKNFVIKNGLEVSEDLIIADPIESRVGVGTTVPEYTLHVNGGIGATNLYVTGVSTFVGFSTFNDDVNIQGDLDVTGSITFTGVTTAFDDVTVQGNLTVAGITTLASTGGITTTGGDLYVNTDFIVGAGATVGGALTVAGNVDLNADLDVDGRTELDITNISETLNVSGISTFGDTVEISSLTDNRIAIVGTGSTIEDDANLTFDGSQLVVAVGATVGGALTVAGNVDLNSDLDVDGRTELDITNISETLNVTGISTFENDVNINQDLTVSGNLDVTGVSTFRDSVNIDGGDLNVSGVVTATSFDGAGQIGISSGGTLIGAAATIVDFTSTNAVVTVTETSAGIATVDISPVVSLGLVLALGG